MSGIKDGLGEKGNGEDQTDRREIEVPGSKLL